MQGQMGTAQLTKTKDVAREYRVKVGGMAARLSKSSFLCDKCYQQGSNMLEEAELMKACHPNYLDMATAPALSKIYCECLVSVLHYSVLNKPVGSNQTCEEVGGVHEQGGKYVYKCRARIEADIST
jgi:hypothetical protein